MKNCKDCGFNNEDTARYCSKCGSKLTDSTTDLYAKNKAEHTSSPIQSTKTISADAEGNPQKWIKHKWKAYSKKQFVYSLLCAFIPTLYILLYFSSIRPKRKFHASLPDKESKLYGQSNTDDFHFESSFRKKHKRTWILIPIILSAVIIFFAISLYSDSGSNWIYAILIAVYGEYYIIVISVFQLLSLKSFKYEIWHYACPHCHWANTIKDTGKSHFETHTSTDIVGTTGGGTTKVGTLEWSDGTKTTITGEKPEYNVYQKREHTSKYNIYICTHCGHEFKRLSDVDIKAAGNRWQGIDPINYK